MAARQLMTFTERAIKHLLTIKNTQQNATGVKVFLKEMGCSGLSFKLDLAYDQALSGYEHVMIKDSQGNPLNVFIDSKALLHVIGTNVDYIDNGINSEFKFENPNAIGQCGCGHSFSVSEKCEKSQLDANQRTFNHLQMFFFLRKQGQSHQNQMLKIINICLENSQLITRQMELSS